MIADVRELLVDALESVLPGRVHLVPPDAMVPPAIIVGRPSVRADGTLQLATVELPVTVVADGMLRTAVSNADALLERVIAALPDDIAFSGSQPVVVDDWLGHELTVVALTTLHQEED